MTLAQHLQITDQHFTPPWLVHHIMDAMGKSNISECLLDPASSELANKLIQADKIFTEADDGLVQDWCATHVFCNPPGGKIGNKSKQSLWAEKFSAEYKKHNFPTGCFVCFNPELLYRIPCLWEDAIVVQLSKRVHYYSEYFNSGLRQGQWSKVSEKELKIKARYAECLDAYQEDNVRGEPHIYADPLSNKSIMVTPGNIYKWTDAPTHSTALVFKGCNPSDIALAFSAVDCIITKLA